MTDQTPVAAPSVVSWSTARAGRLACHGLLTPDPTARPSDVASRMAGVHAQSMAAAELSIGIRMAAGTRSDIRDALWRDRSLVKTFGPRGTVHLLPTDELAMWTGALSIVPSGSDGLPPDVRLSPAETDLLVGAIGEALLEGDLTTDELGERVIAATGPWAGALVIPAFNGAWPRWRRALIPAARRGLLCFGADRGRNVTYASPTRWTPGFAPMDPEVAIGQLVERYLTAYGPATAAQFGRWLAAPTRWATDVFRAMGSRLTPVLLDGTQAWITGPSSGSCAGPGTTAVGSFPATSSGVRLLPYFDAYAVGSQPRELVFPGRAQERALSRGQAGNVPVLLIDGEVRGIWHQRRVGREVRIVVEAFDTLSAAQSRGLRHQVQRVGQILEGDAALTMGTVEAGKHL